MKHYEWTEEDLQHVEFQNNNEWEALEQSDSWFMEDKLFEKPEALPMLNGDVVVFGSYYNPYRLNLAYLAERNKKMSEEQQEVKVIKLWYWEISPRDVVFKFSESVPDFIGNAVTYATTIDDLPILIADTQKWIDSQNAACFSQLEIHEPPRSKWIGIRLPENFKYNEIDLGTDRGSIRIIKTDWQWLNKEELQVLKHRFEAWFPPKPRFELKVTPMVEGEPEESK